MNLNKSDNNTTNAVLSGSPKKSIVEDEDKPINHRCQLEHGLYFKKKLREGKHAACKLGAVAAICFVFCGIEAAGGIISGSLSILTDAAHQLSDVTGFVISLFAVLISQRQATFRKSYGYHRADVLGAILSIMVIWVLLVWLLIEAVKRILEPQEIDGKIMLITAVIGLLCNILGFVILACCGVEENEHGEKENVIASVLSSYKASGVRGQNAPLLTASQRSQVKSSQENKNSKNKVIIDDKDGKTKIQRETGSQELQDLKSGQIIDTEKLLDSNARKVPELDSDEENDDDTENNEKKGGVEDNLNIRAAIIHLLGDTVQSVGVIIAAIIIYIWPSATIADPISTFLFSVLVLMTTIPVFSDCINILMENSPSDVDSVKVYNIISRMDCVEEIHDFHMWSLSAGKVLLTAHIRTNEKNPYQTLHKVNMMLEKRLGIHHATIQIEPSNANGHELKCENVELEN